VRFFFFLRIPVELTQEVVEQQPDVSGFFEHLGLGTELGRELRLPLFRAYLLLVYERARLFMQRMQLLDEPRMMLDEETKLRLSGVLLALLALLALLPYPNGWGA
jgi:hypothetical protein